MNDKDLAEKNKKSKLAADKMFSEYLQRMLRLKQTEMS